MKRFFSIVVALAGAALFQAGCAHPASRAIVLSSTAPVRRAVVEARTSNAQATTIARRAVKHGLAAGSADARAMETLTLATGQQLDAALGATDRLTRQLLEKQKSVDAVVRFAHAETARADRLELSRGRILRLLCESNGAWLLAVVIAGALLQGLLRGLIVACASLMTRAWHAAVALVLRLTPLLLAAV